MTDRYKESIQGARDCVERNKDGGVYLPDLLVVIDSQQAQIDIMLEDLQFRTNQVIEQQAEIEDARICVSSYINKYKSAVKTAKELQSVIAEKEAEIERLNKKVEELSEVLSDTIRIRYAECRAEAIKEFVEKLKNECAFECDVSLGYGRPCYEDAIPIIAIDNLVKEMVGDEN